jgi:hypothetical protein
MRLNRELPTALTFECGFAVSFDGVNKNEDISNGLDHDEN